MGDRHTSLIKTLRRRRCFIEYSKRFSLGPSVPLAGFQVCVPALPYSPQPLRKRGRGGVVLSGLVSCRQGAVYHTRPVLAKKREPATFVVGSPRGRLPTLPLAQYHRRGQV